MDQSKKIKKVTVSLLFVIFAWSSWTDINGLWAELPLMVNTLPEGWNLPAYFTVIIQLANLGPLLYGLISRNIKSKNLMRKIETVSIYLVTCIGCVAIMMLAFFWDQTSYIGGVSHSTALLVLTFFVSLVDCTSSVTFLPFMALFKPIYMTPFYIGESMSGLLPGIIALIQGAGEYSCVNVTNGHNDSNVTYSIQPVYSQPFFPVKDFFITMFVLLLMSIVAFALLKHSTYCQTEYLEWSSDDQQTHERADAAENTPVMEEGVCLAEAPGTECRHKKEEKSMGTMEYIVLMVVMAFINALMNGVLPSIQTYSLLPYGHLYYSLAVRISQIASPLACFVGFCFLPQSRIFIGVLTFICTMAAGYIIVIASHSPFPPVTGSVAGVFMVLIWIIFSSVVSYLRLLLSKLLVNHGGHSTLFWLGVSIQVGSFVGAVVTFLCVTVFQLLQSAPPCD